MTDKIEPALSADGWAATKAGVIAVGEMVSNLGRQGRFDAAIAVSNAALPDSDPRKITREIIADMNQAVDRFAQESCGGRDEEVVARLGPFIDALESYLPPTDG